MNDLKFDNLKQSFHKALKMNKKPYMNIMQGIQSGPLPKPRAFRPPPKKPMPSTDLLWPRFD